jgi:hypothetical protein
MPTSDTATRPVTSETMPRNRTEPSSPRSNASALVVTSIRDASPARMSTALVGKCSLPSTAVLTGIGPNDIHARSRPVP